MGYKKLPSSISHAIIFHLKKLFNSNGFPGNFRESRYFFWSEDIVSKAKISLIPDDEGVATIPLFTFTFFKN